VSPPGRREYLRSIHARYAAASRAEKTAILNEFCRVAGYHRKSALRLLHQPLSVPRSRPRSGRRRYDDEALRVLTRIWAAAGYPWSLRLKALLPAWLPWARRRYQVSPQAERQLLAISARQMDRRLQAHKGRLKKRLFGRTKPGTLLKHHIPLRTDRWRTTAPGFSEVDLVSHSGDCADGMFLHSLNLTDIHTTWTETCAILGKAQVRVGEALDEMRLAVPFRLQGIDSDNGSEFINQHLWDYCQAHEIQFTRGRPYKKDDNAHIEQKNWTHVRKLLGYVRYDTPAAQAAMQALYRHELRLFQNLFLPSVKLLRKERVGARVRRRYDAPRTPLERVLAAPAVDRDRVAALCDLRDRLDPFVLARTIDQKLERIYAPASRQHRPDTGASAAPQRERRGGGQRLSIRPQPRGGWDPARPVTRRMAR
jgi:hypothetical protein